MTELYKLNPREIKERRNSKIQFGSVVYVAQEETGEQLLRVILDFYIGDSVYTSGVTTSQITFDEHRHIKLLKPGGTLFTSIDLVTGLVLSLDEVADGFRRSNSYNPSFDIDWKRVIAKGSVPRHFK